MTGIHISTPTGPNWQYSLDGQTWQSSPDFLHQLDGSDFVLGESYSVHYRNVSQGVLDLETVEFTGALNGDTISQVVARSIIPTTEERYAMLVYDQQTKQVFLSVLGGNGATFNEIMQNGDWTEKIPYFRAGINANLEPLPANTDAQPVVIVADGTFYEGTYPASVLATLPGIVGEATAVQKRDAFLSLLAQAMADPASKAIVCAALASCDVTTPPTTSYPPVFDQFEHFVYETAPEVLPPLYRSRFDENNCASGGNPGTLAGWVIDLNHPETATFIRITKNDQFIADVTATIDRPDVLDALKQLGLVPQDQTFCRFGFGFDKPVNPADNGQLVIWRMFGGASTTEATNDYGKPNGLVCGAATPTNEFRRTGAISTIEGQTTQFGLERKNYDGSWSVVPNDQITWSTVDAPSGVSLPSSGLFGLAADSISSNGSVEVHAAVQGMYTSSISNSSTPIASALAVYRPTF